MGELSGRHVREVYGVPTPVVSWHPDPALRGTRRRWEREDGEEDILGATGSHRWAIASILVFLAAGLLLLLRVDEEEGVKLATAEGAAD